MAEEENVEEVIEESTPSELNAEEAVVEEQVEEVTEPPKPGSIEYTKAVEERIGKITKKAYQAEAKAELYEKRLRELEEKATAPAEEQAPPVQTFNEPEPLEANYEDYNTYIKEVASWQFRKEKSAYEANTAHQSALDKRNKMESDFKARANESVAKEHPDFYEKMQVVNLVPEILEAVLTSDKGPELALHLANNPDIMRDLNTLSPIVAARKLGTIEAKLSDKPTKKTVTQAPNPIEPVNTDTGVTVDDNPKDIKEWMKKRKEREMAKIKQRVEGGVIR